MIIHSYTTQGNRPYQEDTYSIKKYLSQNSSTATETENFSRLNVDLIGVFDGHGGGDISKILKEKLPAYFYKENLMTDNIPKPHPKYNNYIIETFDTLQKQLNVMCNKSTLQGSTVCMCIIYKYKNKKYITSFWTGDSRAVACNQNLIAESLTLDHKPDSPLEINRIKSLGGTVTFEKKDVPRINGVLAVSRSLGDFDQKKFIEHKPDIVHNYCNYKFVVIATDGLWDVMNNQMVIDFILNNLFERGSDILSSNRSNKSDTNIATKLADKAIELGSDDNITVIVYFIDDKVDDYDKYLVNHRLNEI
jgi:serine/threonine protein phosphatase PrpC